MRPHGCRNNAGTKRNKKSMSTSKLMCSAHVSRGLESPVTQDVAIASSPTSLDAMVHKTPQLGAKLISYNPSYNPESNKQL